MSATSSADQLVSRGLADRLKYVVGEIPWAILSVVLLFQLFVADRFAWLDAEGPLKKTTTVSITSGMGVGEIADVLAEGGVIADRLGFAQTVRLLGQSGSLKAGHYAFEASTTPRSVISTIAAGKVARFRLTLPEGWTSTRVVARINEAPHLTGQITTVPEEGSLAPGTYFYGFGHDRAKLVRQIRHQAARDLRDVWKRRQDGLPLKTPYEMQILASIVEKETGRSTERAHVAAVFLNRLRRGMRLQADPTVIYAVTRGKAPLNRPISAADLRLRSKFNTYVVKGLPPTPIANPGVAALKAVANPLDSDDLFFVANGEGGHWFAKTYDAHLTNVARYRKLMRARASR